MESQRDIKIPSVSCRNESEQNAGMVFHAAECAYCIALAFASAALPVLQLQALRAS